MAEKEDNAELLADVGFYLVNSGLYMQCAPSLIERLVPHIPEGRRELAERWLKSLQ